MVKQTARENVKDVVKERYDVFISYRRDGGEGIARSLYDRLTGRGYSVAYDREALSAGRFDGQLLRAMSNCKDVIVILNNGVELSKLPPDNMFMQEITFALKTERNVIPLMMDRFKFPAELPPDISGLAMRNGIGADMEYFDSAVGKLCRFLKAKPKGWLRRKFLWLSLACILAAAAFGVYAWTTPGVIPCPMTVQDKYHFSKFIGDLVQRGTIYQELMSAKKNLLRDSGSGDVGAYGAAVAEFMNSVKSMSDRFDRCLPIGEVGRLADRMPIDAGHLVMLIASMRGDFDNLQTWADSITPGSKMNKRDRARFIDTQKAFLDAKCELFSCKLMMLLCDVSPSAVKGIKEAAQTWTMFPRLSQPWLRDKEELERHGMFLTQKIEEATHDMETVVGNVRQSLEHDYDAMRLWLIAGGYTPERAEKMVEKIREDNSLEAQLRQAKRSLDSKKERHDRANADDSTAFLLGKALRFIGSGMYDEAADCIKIIRERTSHEGGKSANDYPAETLATLDRIAQLRGKVPFTGGVLVIGIEPPATSHAFYKVGDVITAVDGEHCTTFNDYAARQKAGKKVVLYRLNGAGVFDKYEFTMPDNQPRVGLVGFGK